MNQHFIPDSHVPARFLREMTRHPYKAGKVPVEREYRFDGQGGYAPRSGRIPRSIWPIVVIVLGVAAWMFKVGVFVGF